MSKKWIFVVILVIVLGAVFVSRDNGVPVRAAKVKEGQVREYIEERAKTTLPRIFYITMPLNGRVKPIKWKEGDFVAKEQVLATLDKSDLTTAMIQVESRLRMIESRIEVSHYNSMEKTALKESDSGITAVKNAVKATEKKVEASKERLGFAQGEMNRAEKANATVSHQELKKLRTEYVQAKIDYQADQFTLYALEAVLTATKLAPVYVNQYLTRKRLSREILLSEKAGTEALLKQAQRNLARAVIKSEIDGVVLKRYVENERMLPAGAPLLELGDLTNLEVTADVLSEEVVKIAKGNRVDIYGAAIGEKPIQGTVTLIERKGFTKISSLGVEQQRVSVIIAVNRKDLEMLKKQGHELGVDYRVRVRIYTATGGKGAVIPRTALFRGDGGKWKTFTIRDGKAEMVDIAVGLINEREAEVTEGLKIGDQVVVAPESSLVSGQKVQTDR